MDFFPAFLVLGAAAGLLAGLLGVGGGLVIVPTLAFLFHRLGFPEANVMHLAIGTSLATIIVTAISSVMAHNRRGSVLWPVFWHLTPGIVLGAAAAAAVADALPSDWLRLVFAVFVLLVAAQMAFNINPRPQRPLPGTLAQGIAGTVVGFVSAIVGVGGGTLTVPYLIHHRVPPRNAVGTSAGCGLPIALAGSAGYAIAGWGETSFADGFIGYVYWPAFVGIVIASALFAPLGARLAHRLPAGVLKKVFAAFMVVIGLRMLFFV